MTNQLSNQKQYPIIRSEAECPFTYIGVALVCDVKHMATGRIYTTRDTAKAVAQWQQTYLHGGKQCLGQLDYPETHLVDLANVSHIVEDVWMDNVDGLTVVKAKIKTVSTPNGQLIKSLYDSGVNLGLTTVALGTVRENHTVSDISLTSISVVNLNDHPKLFKSSEISS